LCAIWPAAGGDEIWVTRFIAVPRVGETLTFAEGWCYRVVRVEHEADLPEAALAQHVALFVEPPQPSESEVNV
jgi:hypothetical protein